MVYAETLEKSGYNQCFKSYPCMDKKECSLWDLAQKPRRSVERKTTQVLLFSKKSFSRKSTAWFQVFNKYRPTSVIY